MMLTVSLTILVIGCLFLANKLRGIQKRSRSYLQFTKLQEDIMDYMLTDGTNISNSDYRKVRKMIDINNKLLDVHSCYRPSSFHIRTFFSFLKGYAKPVFDMERRVQSLRPKDEKLKELQTELVYSIEWSIFYNTPRYVTFFVIFSIFSFVVSLFAVRRTREFYKWYNAIIDRQAKSFMFQKYSSFHPYFARG